MDIENKTPIHVGLFGHIDSGKTAVASVLSEVISTAGIDAHPQSQERGITIDLGFTSFVIEDYLITLVDGPGHADLIKISASSVEIIDCALLVIDITKGPQVQTGEHLIMIESLNINKLIVVLNKTDLFKGDLKEEIKKTRNFFSSTSFGSDDPIYLVSAKKAEGFDALREGILQTIQSLTIERDTESSLVIPIDHHFSIKGRGPVITGTILSGTSTLNQDVVILPPKLSGKVKNIQIFHQNVSSAQAGDRVGINLKNIDIKKVYRGCYLTDNPEIFEFCDLMELEVKKNTLFKPEVQFGTQVHVTIGMFTTVGKIYPYYEKNGKKIQSKAKNTDTHFKAFLWLNEMTLLRKNNPKILLSRLDLPPTTLRILGAAEVLQMHFEPPLLHKYKVKRGQVKNPSHSQGIVCTGLAQSYEGAKRIVGRSLESPYTKIIDTFGTKGAVIVGIEKGNHKVNIGEPVILKELRSFPLKKI